MLRRTFTKLDVPGESASLVNEIMRDFTVVAQASTHSARNIERKPKPRSQQMITMPHSVLPMLASSHPDIISA
jgi:hypothetical protein